MIVGQKDILLEKQISKTKYIFLQITLYKILGFLLISRSNARAYYYALKQGNLYPIKQVSNSTHHCGQPWFLPSKTQLVSANHEDGGENEHWHQKQEKDKEMTEN